MKNSLKSLRLKALAFCIPLFFLLTGCENPLFNTVTAELDYITVTKKPSVTLYELNESLDITGLEVTGTYTDRKTKRETVALEHITGYDSTVLGSQPLTVTVGGKTAVFTVFVAVEKLLSISVTGPDRTVFGLGEDIDLTGLVVTGHYADSTLCTEAVTSANISGYDSMTLGTKTIMVTVNGKTAYFTVTVTNARLVSIAVTAPPDRADYWWGEALDITGLKVTGTYTDSTARLETITMSNISGYDSTRHGKQVVTITLNGTTAAFTVNVVTPVLISIGISSVPTKTVYPRGTPLELAGLVVTGTYSDGSTKTEAVTSANISGYDSMSVRTQTIIVSINGLTAYFNVTVTAPVLDSIQVIALPSKTVYVTGEAFNISGLTVLGTYTDSTMGLQPVAAGQISGYNATSAGTQTLTVTMGTVSTTFTVTVCGLDHIRVIQLPSKVVYAQGESLDPTGIEVQGIYIGAGISTERIISGSALSISGFNSTQTGPQNLTVSAHGKTTNFIVFVDD